MKDQFTILNRLPNIGEIIKIDDEETIYKVIYRNYYNWLALLDNDSNLYFFYPEEHVFYTLTTPVKEELKHPTNKHFTIRYMIFNMGSSKEDLIK